MFQALFILSSSITDHSKVVGGHFWIVWIWIFLIARMTWRRNASASLDIGFYYLNLNLRTRFWIMIKMFSHTFLVVHVVIYTSFLLIFNFLTLCKINVLSISHMADYFRFWSHREVFKPFIFGWECKCKASLRVLLLSKLKKRQYLNI